MGIITATRGAWASSHVLVLAAAWTSFPELRLPGAHLPAWNCHIMSLVLNAHLPAPPLLQHHPLTRRAKQNHQERVSYSVSQVHCRVLPPVDTHRWKSPEPTAHLGLSPEHLLHEGHEHQAGSWLLWDDLALGHQMLHNLLIMQAWGT